MFILICYNNGLFLDYMKLDQRTFLAARWCTTPLACLCKQLVKQHSQSLDWLLGVGCHSLFYMASVFTSSDALWFLPMRVHRGSGVYTSVTSWPKWLASYAWSCSCINYYRYKGQGSGTNSAIISMCAVWRRVLTLNTYRTNCLIACSFKV